MSYICSICVGDVFLKRQLSESASNEYPCEYCDGDAPTVHISFVASRCKKVIDIFFEVSSLTLAVIHFNRDPAGESLEAIVERITSMPSAAVEAVVEEITDDWHCDDTGEDLYGEDPHFIVRKSVDSPFFAAWTEMESSLREEARYLNPKMDKFMQSVFGGLSHHVEMGGNSVLVSAGPDTSINELCRARAFESEKELEESLQHPERTLGTPPAGSSRKGGRMNALGQPAFYGAMDEHTAIAEIRPPVGSWVAVARFKITRPLKLLNLRLLATAQLKKGFSYFDPATIDDAQRVSFLRALAKTMTTPVMPEKEHHNYLITQVVADHLAMLEEINVDGILYPSAQKAGSDDETGTNVVLFHKAAIAKNARRESNTAQAELRVYIDEEPGSYFDPAIMFFNEKEKQSGWILPGFHPNPALELVQDGIQLHEITAVSFTTKSRSLKLITDDPRSRGG